MKRIPGCIFTAKFKREAIDSDLQRMAGGEATGSDDRDLKCGRVRIPKVAVGGLLPSSMTMPNSESKPLI